MALIQKVIKKRKQTGFTVIEVMIVLSVSMVLFAIAVSGYFRQNQKLEFTNAVRDTEVVIQDILNDVSIGYYPKSNTFNCTRGGSPEAPVLNPLGSAEQGTNKDCIFLGKAVDVNNGSMVVYTIVGLRNSSSDPDVASSDVEDARNRTIPYSSAFENHVLSASIDIIKIITSSGADSAGFAVVSGFGNGEEGGAGATTTQVSVASISTTPAYDFTSSVSQVVSNSNLNQDVTICIEETGGGRQASITIGSGAQNNIETMIDGWAPQCN